MPFDMSEKLENPYLNVLDPILDNESLDKKSALVAVSRLMVARDNLSIDLKGYHGGKGGMPSEDVKQAISILERMHSKRQEEEKSGPSWLRN